MKILITGGSGFVGSHLTDELVKNHDVTVYDNYEAQVHNKVPDYLNDKARYVNADVLDRDILKYEVINSDVIFHEAAMVGVGQSMYQMLKYANVNIMGTMNLLDILANEEHNVKKLVVASSMSIYGEGEYKCQECGDNVYPEIRDDIGDPVCPVCDSELASIATTENKPLHPTSVYAITKRDQEEMCLTVGKAYGIPTTALRYFNIFGPRQSLNNPYTGVCAIFSSRIKNNNPPIIYEDGLQCRDFVSVHDIVQANVLAMNNSNSNYQAYNVGSGEDISILKVAKTLISLYGYKMVPHITNKYRSGDVRNCYADITKIKKLGYKPTVSFVDGMKELVKWGETETAIDKTDMAYQELVDRGLV